MRSASGANLSKRGHFAKTLLALAEASGLRASGVVFLAAAASAEHITGDLIAALYTRMAVSQSPGSLICDRESKSVKILRGGVYQSLLTLSKISANFIKASSD
jgi:hypothetical protein